MKRARILLRVSSSQQLEADGDLTVQRQLVQDYIFSHEDWMLDEKEYFEGSSSGYKNPVASRNVLQDALQDARNKEYDILVAYKDDRIGRLMWEIGAYVMELKSYGVDIYTVKDGCISPSQDDIMGQIMLALRYGNAQKSSADTGVRVKDTARKLVAQGKFMGGTAPYGYELVLSGEISKHGRALHRLSVIPERAAIVRYIYELSLYREYGSQKIARILNEREEFRVLAPHSLWKSGTVSGILTNPVYTGHAAYKRREHVNGKYRRTDSHEWILSSEADRSIALIDMEAWKKVQEKRGRRRSKSAPKAEALPQSSPGPCSGPLAFIGILYCGYCGSRLINASRYSYWTLKATGERRSRKIPVYECPHALQGIPHAHRCRYRADSIEPPLFQAVSDFIERLLQKESLSHEMERIRKKAQKDKERELAKIKREYSGLQEKILMIEDKIPESLSGNSPFSPGELASLHARYREQSLALASLIRQKEPELEKLCASSRPRSGNGEEHLSWKELFLNADISAKRVLIRHVVRRIDIKESEIIIRFKAVTADSDAPPTNRL